MNKLAICLFGRNDDYMPDFLYRMTVTINFIAASLKRVEKLDDVEVVVLDWGSEVPLSKVIDLSFEAKRITRFIYVAAEPAGKIPLCSAFNLVVKNAKAEYVSFCGADALIPSASFDAIFRVIDGKTSIQDPHLKYFNCGRHVLPHQVVESQPSVAGWERFLRLNSWQLEKQQAYGGFLYGNAGFLLFHRNMIAEAKGLNELFNSGWGWNDIDLTVRLLHKYQWHDLAHEGFLLYDMEHSPIDGGRVQAVKQKPPHYIATTICENEEWGQVAYATEEQASQYQPDLVLSHEPFVRLKMNVDQESVYRVTQFLMDYQKHINWCAVSNREKKALTYLSAFASQSRKNATLLDVNSIHGLSSFFFAVLYPWGEIYSATNWERIDDRSGPHEFAKVLGSHYIGHKGYLSVLSGVTQDSLDSYFSAISDDLSCFDMIVVRDLPNDLIDVNCLIQRLSPAGMMLLLPEQNMDRSTFESILGRNGRHGVSVQEDDSGFFVVTKELDIDDHTSASCDLEVPLALDQAELNQYFSLAEFCERVKKLPIEKRILWGLGTVGKIVYDLIPTPVAIVDNGLYAKGEVSFNGVPIIPSSQIGEYEVDSILISAVNHYEAIYAEARLYSTKVERIFF